MLSMQVGDIAVILKTIAWIKQNCFDPSSQASTRYRELKNRIEDFGHALEKLKDVASQIQPSSVAGPLRAPTDQGQSLNLERYQATLEECKVFLLRHASVENRVTSPFENGRWAMNREREVQALVTKINEHYMSAIFHLGVSHLNQQQRRSAIPQVVQKAPPLSTVWEYKFEQSLLFDDSLKLQSTEDIPLPRSTEAIHGHLTRSEPLPSSPSFQRPPTDHPSTASQYLHLLKAQYLLEKTKVCTAFRQELENSKVRQYVAHLEHAIAQRHGAFEVQPDLEILLTQWAKDQSVWLRPAMAPPERRSSSLLPTQLEKEILHLQLSNQGMYTKDELYITKISDSFLRLKRKRTYNATDSTDTEASLFRLHEDKLIPWYVINPDVGLGTQPSAGKGEEFHLKNRRDKLRLQAAFTGYDVCRPQDAFANVDFSVTISKGIFSSRKQESGIGEIQLWNAITNAVPAVESPTSPLGSFASSTQSTPTIAATTITKGMNPSIFTYTANETGTAGNVEGKLPPPPLLVAFTHTGGLYRIWRVDCKFPRTNLF
jgi:hypothetical protein